MNTVCKQVALPALLVLLGCADPGRSENKGGTPCVELFLQAVPPGGGDPQPRGGESGPRPASPPALCKRGEYPALLGLRTE